MASKIFYENAKEFLSCRESIDALWASLNKNIMVSLQSIDNQIEHGKGNFNNKLRQKNAHTGDVVNDLNELYESGNIAQVVLKSMLEDIVVKSDAPSAIIVVPDLKQRQRALEKSIDDYGSRNPGPAISWLFDIVRGSIICETEENLSRILLQLLQSSSADGPFEVVRMKNRFVNPTAGGFRDVNVNISVVIATSSTGFPITHICEVQFHLHAIKNMDEIKRSHELYEYFRSYFRGSTEAVESRLAMLAAVINSVNSNVPGAGIADLVKDIIVVGNLSQMELCSEFVESIGEFGFAIQIQTEMLRLVEVQYGPINQYVARIASNLGRLLCGMGNLSEGKLLFEKALKVCEEVLGDDNAATLGCAMDLAEWFSKSGDYPAAKSLLERVIVGREKTLGPSHPDTLASIRFFGKMLSNMGDYARAKVMNERALHAYEVMLGSNQLSSLNIHVVQTLASVLDDMRDFQRATELLTRVLFWYEKVNGPDHAVTLNSVQVLGTHLCNMGDLSGAKIMLERAVVGFERTLGPENVCTLGAITEFGRLYCRLRDYARAKPLLERAFVGFMKTVGPDNMFTINAMSAFGVLLRNSGDFAGARFMFEGALRSGEKVMGPYHTSTLATIDNLGQLLHRLGDSEGAKALFERALKAKEESLGKDHVLTLASVHSLARCLYDKRDLSKAKEMFERELAGREKAQGANDLSTLETVDYLARLLLDMGDSNGAKLMGERALLGYEKVKGPQSLHVLNAMNSLGSALHEMGDNSGAKLMFERVLRSGNTAPISNRVTASNFQSRLLGIFPAFVDTDLHQHRLQLTLRAPYPGGCFGCDICHLSSFGVLYRCADCGFDIHPHCMQHAFQFELGETAVLPEVGKTDGSGSDVVDRKQQLLDLDMPKSCDIEE